jgi:hypothetical protein
VAGTCSKFKKLREVVAETAGERALGAVWETHELKKCQDCMSALAWEKFLAAKRWCVLFLSDFWPETHTADFEGILNNP